MGEGDVTQRVTAPELVLCLTLQRALDGPFVQMSLEDTLLTIVIVGQNHQSVYVTLFVTLYRRVASVIQSCREWLMMFRKLGN